ncbi:MAG: serine/threonine-protein kinase [Myxococcales bacterium]|nr:serine/threonine protein kinase [Polyangiaceae bacterium]MDW8248052.1 serine/threonine-protein kinase [Myxococcales bacterium]
MTTDPQEDRFKRAKARVGGVLKEKWHLDALLGVGGMAAVYLATHRNNGKRVAVKMLHSELSVISQIKTRFLREGYASNKVNHPGVVSVLDDDVAEDGSVYLVMELLEGENLEQRRAAAGGCLDLQEVLWIVDQLLDVLRAAHAVGIVHRDIKPENIFLTRDATLKVLDFGLARVRDPRTSAGLTRTNVLMGTLDFMSPEQARGKWDGVDARSDIWSVGATMFMLLTGHPVHEEATLDGQLKAVATRPPRSLRQLRPDLPTPVIALVDRALAFHPHDRWPDAFSMQEAVREAYNKLGEVLPTSTHPPPVEPTLVNASTLVTSPSWDADLAQTQALTRPRFNEDAVTRVLPPSLPLAGLSSSSPSPVSPPEPAAPPPVPSSAPPLTPDPIPLPLEPSVATSPAPMPAPMPVLTRRRLWVIAASFPVGVLLFWGLSSLRGCEPTPASQLAAPSQVSTSAASLLSPSSISEPPEPPPKESATPPPSASTGPARPSRPAPHRGPRKKQPH